MAASKIIPKKSVISKIPLSTDLENGEICINHADRKLYAKHPSSGAIQEIGAYEHSHDELYSIDGTQHLELQNNGDLTLPNGGTISDSSVAGGSITLTPPSATNQWTLGVDGSTIFPNNTLKGYSFTSTNTVTNYIPQAGSFLYSDSAILGLISSIGGAWYIKGPGLVGWKQITQAQDNSGVALILRIGSGNTPLPDGSEFPSGGGNVYTISQYLEFDLKVADKTWVFNKDGNLTLPASGDILDSNGTSVLGGGGVSTINDLDEMFNSARANYYHEVGYTAGGDVSAIEVYATSAKATHLYSRAFTYNASGNITQILTTDQQNAGVSLTKTITYTGSGDIATVTRSYSL